AEREEVQAPMAAEHASIIGAHDRPRRIRHVVAQKILHPDLSDEADALAVLLVGGGESGFAREPAQLPLEEVADREAGVRELLLREQGEKVGLILIRIGSLEESVLCSAGGTTLSRCDRGRG